VEVGGFFNAFGNGVVYPFLFIYLHNVRGFPLSTAGLVLATNAVVALAFGPFAGTLIDRFGARATLAPSLVLLATGFGCLSLVRAPWHAYACAAVFGLGNAGFWPSQSALLAGLTPETRRHATYGLQRVTMNLGFGLGGAAAGLIASTSHPTTFTVLFLLDAATYLFFAVLLIGVPEAKVPAAREDEARVGYREALRDRVLVSLLVLNVVFTTAGYAQLETLPAFAKNHAGVSERGIGLIFLVNTIVIVLAQLPVGKALEGRRRMPALALMTVLWASSWFLVLLGGVWLKAAAATAVLAVAAGIFGIGECFQGSTQQALVADLAPPRLRGRYMALASNSWSLGWIIGPALGGYLLQHAPLSLWPAAAGTCLVAGLGALALERRIPEHARRTPLDLPAPAVPAPLLEDPLAERLTARLSG
jgi:MFS family permease